MKMRQRSEINPPGMQFDGMSQGVRVGNTIHISGQVALCEGKLVGIGDIRRQAQQCFANIAAILEMSDAQLSDVVSLRCYLTNAADYPIYAEVKNALFADHPPCGTAVIVKGLLNDDLLLEVEAVAELGAG